MRTRNHERPSYSNEVVRRADPQARLTHESSRMLHSPYETTQGRGFVINYSR